MQKISLKLTWKSVKYLCEQTIAWVDVMIRQLVVNLCIPSPQDTAPDEGY